MLPTRLVVTALALLVGCADSDISDDEFADRVNEACVNQCRNRFACVPPPPSNHPYSILFGVSFEQCYSICEGGISESDTRTGCRAELLASAECHGKREGECVDFRAAFFHDKAPEVSCIPEIEAVYACDPDYFDPPPDPVSRWDGVPDP